MEHFSRLLLMLLALTTFGCEMGGYSTENPDAFCIKLLAKGSRETREWLSEGPRNTLGIIQSREESLSFINELYALGAPHVFAVEIDRYPDGMENTGKLVVELPADSEKRPGVLKWAANIVHEQGFDADSDVGQTYVFVVLD